MSTNKPIVAIEGAKTETQKQKVSPEQILFRVEKLGKIEFAKRQEEESKKNILLLQGHRISESELYVKLRKEPENHAPIFTRDTEFYSELERLNPGLGSLAQYVKPPWVGGVTRQMVYDRLFSKEHYDQVTDPANNPRVSKGVYKYKFYQYLSKEDLLLVRNFIWDAVEEMKASTTMVEFQQRMHAKYNIPYQLKIPFPSDD